MRSNLPGSMARRRVLWLGVAALGWLIVVAVLVPAIIRSAWAGESLPFFNRIVSGRAQHPVEFYLGMWWRLAAIVTVGVIAFGFVLHVTRTHWSHLPAALQRITAALPGSGLAGLLLVAAAAGFAGGLAEATGEIVRHRVRHLPTGAFVSGELFWLAPVAAVFGLFTIAVALYAVDRLFRARGAVVGAGAFLLVAIAVFSFLRSLAFGLAEYAVVILSAGAGIVFVRSIMRYPRGSRRVLRAMVTTTAVALVFWAAVVPLSRLLKERRAISTLPAPPADAPNVLIVIWDAVRAQNLSLYGYERRTTPALEQLAERGVVFERAFSTAPWSLPSHASLFTGQNPSEMTAGYSSPMDETHATIAEILSREGYATGGFTANLFYGSADYGIARGFTHYDSRPPLDLTTVAHTWWLSRTLTTRVRWQFGKRQTLLRRRADDVSRAFQRWVRRHGDRPFLAVLNHFDAHEPYLAPEPYNLAFSNRQPRYWLVNDEEVYTDEVLSEFKTAYDTCILYLDSELQKLLDFLDREGKLDNTLIIVTADHGEEFGEYHRRVVGHSKTMRAQSLRVPLVIVPPGGTEATRRRDVASIRDVPATVMDVLGLADRDPFPGVALLDHESAQAPAWSVIQLATMEQHRWARPSLVWPSAAGDMFSLFAENWHYIIDGRDGEQLYDLDRDPRQENNLVGDTTLTDVVERFRMALDSMVPMVDGVRRARRFGTEPD